MIELQNVSVIARDKIIVDKINFKLDDGDWLMLVGPNGAGKTSLIKAILSSVDYSGKILLYSKDIQKLKGKDKAKLIGAMGQHHSADYDFMVQDVVELGRYAYNQSPIGSLSKEDQKFVDWALKSTGMDNKRTQSIRSLSGGELQRTYLAQVFAQDPDILILDEPTNHLDIRYEQLIFNLVKNWLNQGNKAVISIVHDLSLASLYGNKTLLLDKGKQVVYGDKSEFFNNKYLDYVYETNVKEYMYKKFMIWAK